MSVELDGVNNVLKTDTISEVTSANGVTVDGLSIKDSKLVTADSVIEANMSANSVDSDSYVDGSIDTVHIADLNVTTGKIAADAITAAKIADNAVVTAGINADAVTGAKIADDAINSEHYTDGSIDTAHLADGQVTVGKLATAVFTGATDIGAAIVDADLFLMDDGAGGTIRKTTAARLKTYIPGVGKVLQVVNTGSSTETSSSSTTYADSSLTAAITPSASSSKVLVIMNMSLAMYEDSGTGNEFQAAIYRDINGGGFGRIYAGQGNTYGGLSGHASGEITAAFPTTLTFVDAPNTTAAVTYKLFINVSSGNNVNTGSSSMERSVTLMEIGA